MHLIQVSEYEKYLSESEGENLKNCVSKAILWDISLVAI